MTRKLRVSLPNIKGFARIYELAEANTLYAFHKQMLVDMEFPQDQMVLFKGFDENGQLVARYATFDLGQGSIEHISIKRVIEAGIVQFTYFYDTTNKKSVIITLEGEGVSNTLKPVLLESKGPVPQEFLNGYVAFEDLPPEKRKPVTDDDDLDDDDDDLDSEEEEEDDEDFKETYPDEDED